MSSTNRSKARSEHISDFYVTPKQAIKDFLNDWLLDMQEAGHWIADRPDRASYLDPCAGGDAKHGMSYVEVLKDAFDAEITSVDIREDSRAEIKEDYLLPEGERKYLHKDIYDVIITNPPFNKAQAIIERALEDVKPGGFVIMLLRLNFFESKARRDFWGRNMPEYTYVHSRRMSFTDDGVTDSVEYMHCVWRKGYHPKHTKLSII